MHLYKVRCQNPGWYNQEVLVCWSPTMRTDILTFMMLEITLKTTALKTEKSVQRCILH